MGAMWVHLVDGIDHGPPALPAKSARYHKTTETSQLVQPVQISELGQETFEWSSGSDVLYRVSLNLPSEYMNLLHKHKAPSPHNNTVSY